MFLRTRDDFISDSEIPLVDLAWSISMSYRSSEESPRRDASTRNNTINEALWRKYEAEGLDDNEIAKRHNLCPSEVAALRRTINSVRSP